MDRLEWLLSESQARCETIRFESKRCFMSAFSSVRRRAGSFLKKTFVRAAAARKFTKVFVEYSARRLNDRIYGTVSSAGSMLKSGVRSWWRRLRGRGGRGGRIGRSVDRMIRRRVPGCRLIARHVNFENASNRVFDGIIDFARSKRERLVAASNSGLHPLSSDPCSNFCRTASV